MLANNHPVPVKPHNLNTYLFSTLVQTRFSFRSHAAGIKNSQLFPNRSHLKTAWISPAGLPGAWGA